MSDLKTMCDACEYIGKKLPKYPIIFEIGCTYVVNQDNLINTSTNNIIQQIVIPKNGMLYSFDINSDHINICKRMLRDIGINWSEYMDFVFGDSIEMIPIVVEDLERQDHYIDVVLFDSKEHDEDHMVKEFEGLKDQLSEKHILMVDDVINPNSIKAKKMMPLLQKLGYEMFIVPTETGLLIASMGYKL